MKKFLNKILIFLCATLFLLLGAGCWGDGTGSSGTPSKHEQDGRAAFETIPVGMYVDGEKNENGWEILGYDVEILGNGRFNLILHGNPYGQYELGDFLVYENDYYKFQMLDENGNVYKNGSGEPYKCGVNKKTKRFKVLV